MLATILQQRFLQGASRSPGLLFHLPIKGVLPEADEAMQRWEHAKLLHKETYTYGYKEPLANDLLGELVAMSTMMACFGWAIVGPLLTLSLACIALLYQDAVAATGFVLIVSSMYLPANPCWMPWVQLPVWETWRRYFRFRWVVSQAPMDPSKNFLFLHFPHGSFPMGSWLSISVCAQGYIPGFPPSVAAAIASVLLRAPLFRHIYTWMGCYPAEKQVIKDLLQHQSLGITPEGIAGVFHGADKRREQVYFSKRKGLINIALQTGADIVPVYMLGQSQIFTFNGFPDLSRRLRATVGLFWGRWGTVIPCKTDLIMLIGAPIAVEKIQDPSRADVEKLHTRVTDAVVALFNEHKQLLPGWEKKELRVL